MTTVASILFAYRADRMPVVASVQRLDSTIQALDLLTELDVAALTRQRLTEHVDARVATGMLIEDLAPAARAINALLR